MKNISNIIKATVIIAFLAICALSYFKFGNKLDDKTLNAKVIDDYGTWAVNYEENQSKSRYEHIKILDNEGNPIKIDIKENPERENTITIRPIEPYKVGDRYKLMIEDARYKNNINNNYVRDFEVSMKPLKVVNLEKINDNYRMKITFDQNVKVNANLYEHIFVGESSRRKSKENLNIEMSNEEGNYKVIYIDIKDRLYPNTMYNVSVQGKISSIEGNPMFERFNEEVFVDKILLDEKLGLGKYESQKVSLNREYDWYLEQKGTGDFEKSNSGPAVAAMTAKWILENESVTIRRAREIYYPEGDEWFIDTLMSFYKEFSIKARIESEIDSNKIIEQLDKGNLIVSYIDPSYIQYNNDKDKVTGRITRDNTPHYIIIKGYAKVDDKVFYEVYDPYTFGKDSSKSLITGKDRYYSEENVIKAIKSTWDNMAIIEE